MKILQVHKYLYRKAGAEAYLFDVAELLATHGNAVALWGCRPPSRHSESASWRVKNPVHGSTGSFAGAQDDIMIYEDLLVEPLNFDKREGIVRDLKKFGHMIWSTEAARKFDEVLGRFKPDVIHIHNIYHHLSPSILSVAARHNIPVVMTVHDFKLINPNYSLFDHGEICERDNLRAILHRCIKNSYIATLADVAEMTIHRKGDFYRRGVTRFLVPVPFAKEKLVQHGIPSGKMTVLPLPINPSPQSSPTQRTRAELGAGQARGEEEKRNSPPLVGGVSGGGGDYILFAGRLADSKGLDVLLRVAARLRDIQFNIAGTGPELEKVTLKIKQLKLKNVELLGFVQKEKLQRVIADARLIVVPSQWYEVSPFAVLEPMAQGKAVMASNLGGMANLIEDGKTGFLVEPPHLASGHPLPEGEGRVRGWVDAIEKVYYDEKLLKHVGEAARQQIIAKHDPERHYQALMEIYEKVLR